MSYTARQIANDICVAAMKLRNRSIKAQQSWFGESMSAIESDCRTMWDEGERLIQDYAEQVSRDRAEPLRHTIDTLRAANDVLRAQLAATQAERKEK